MAHADARDKRRGAGGEGKDEESDDEEDYMVKLPTVYLIFTRKSVELGFEAGVSEDSAIDEALRREQENIRDAVFKPPRKRARNRREIEGRIEDIQEAYEKIKFFAVPDFDASDYAPKVFARSILMLAQNLMEDCKKPTCLPRRPDVVLRGHSLRRYFTNIINAARSGVMELNVTSSFQQALSTDVQLEVERVKEAMRDQVDRVMESFALDPNKIREEFSKLVDIESHIHTVVKAMSKRGFGSSEWEREVIRDESTKLLFDQLQL